MAQPAGSEPALDSLERRFVAGDVLFKEGELGSEAFLLREGRVRLIKRVGALERSLRVMGPGELFGESALHPGTPHGSTAVALSDGLLLAMDRRSFHDIVVRSPAISAAVAEQLIRRLRDAEDQVEILMLRDTQAKVVVALLKLAQRMPPSRDRAVSVSISPMELSSRVGLDVDTVKRVVQQLRDGGYLRLVDERVVIPDVDALRELHSLLDVKDQIVGGAPAPPGPRTRGTARGALPGVGPGPSKSH
jgi:CRP-like cAMP-binding protein